MLTLRLIGVFAYCWVLVWGVFPELRRRRYGKAPATLVWGAALFTLAIVVTNRILGDAW